jgi:hypothetical protein
MRCAPAAGATSPVFRIDDIKVVSGAGSAYPGLPVPALPSVESFMAHRAGVGEFAVEERP